MCKLGCCGTFTVVVNDFSGQVLVIKCWFLSITATTTPDSSQLLPAKIAQQHSGRKSSSQSLIVVHPLRGFILQRFRRLPRKDFLRFCARASPFELFFVLSVCQKPTTVSPTPLNPSCFTSGICAFVIARTSKAISVRAPFS